MKNWLFYGGLFAANILLVSAGFTTPAEAQGAVCSSTPIMQYELRENHGEELRETRPADVAGGVVELWVNPDNGSFSILIYPSEGQACMVAAGHSDSFIEQEV